MHRTVMIAEYLRPYAQWRIARPDPADDCRNARAAIGLIDAAAYVAELDDCDRVIVRMAVAGCFAKGRFDPGPEGEALVRHWHYDEAVGGAADLLEGLAACAERAASDEPAERAASVEPATPEGHAGRAVSVERAGRVAAFSLR
ncbi:hypothetical protein ABZ914_02295 [Spirillospora sp. NPDC046719]